MARSESVKTVFDHTLAGTAFGFGSDILGFLKIQSQTHAGYDPLLLAVTLGIPPVIFAGFGASIGIGKARYNRFGPVANIEKQTVTSLGMGALIGEGAALIVTGTEMVLTKSIVAPVIESSFLLGTIGLLMGMTYGISRSGAFSKNHKSIR